MDVVLVRLRNRLSLTSVDLGCVDILSDENQRTKTSPLGASILLKELTYPQALPVRKVPVQALQEDDL